MRSGPYRPSPGPGVVLHATPHNVGWRNLEFAVVEVRPGQPHYGRADGRETAIVTLSGTGTISGGGVHARVQRTSVFEQVASVAYFPPGTDYTVEADGAAEGDDASGPTLTVAIGSAPAEGLLPARCIEPWEMRTEIRGGGQSHRQVVHTLSHPLPAERLIVYEVYVPRGTWAGWPPHRHDGVDGSPYLEETYYFRLDRPEGYVLHRNFCDGAGPDEHGLDDHFDDVSVAHDGDLVCVPMGYHTTVVSPGSNMYFLNFLAGDLLMDERVTPPCFHADHTWITDDWEAGAWGLPVVTLPPAAGR